MTSHEKQLFIADVRRHMQERQWNPSRLAQQTGINQGQVSRIAAGQFKTFSSNVMKICIELGIRPERYYSKSAADANREKIANAAISIWKGTAGDATAVVSLLREIAKLRN